MCAVNISAATAQQQRLFDSFYALNRDNLSEAQHFLSQVKNPPRLNWHEQLRYHALQGELKLKLNRVEEAIAILEAGQKLAKSHPKADLNLVQRLQYSLGCAYFKAGSFTKAHRIHSALAKNTQDTRLRLKLYNQIGFELLIIGLVNNPLEQFRRALAWSIALEQSYEQGRACYGAAVCEKELGNYEQAEYYAQSSFRLLKDSKDYVVRAMLAQVMSELCLERQNYEQAEAHQREAIRLANLSDQACWIAATSAGLANVFAASGQLAEARVRMEVARRLSPKHNIFLAFQLARYAGFLTLQGRDAEAEDAFQGGLEHAEKGESAARASSYYMYGLSLEKRGNYRRAAQVIRKAIEINEAAPALIG